MKSDDMILPRKPSQELLNLIDEVGKLAGKLSDLLEKINRKALEKDLVMKK